MASQVEGGGDRTISTNRRARHEYEILETVEAGLVLRGTEVKSLRDGGVTFKDSYATIRNTEGWLVGCHINPYSHGNIMNHEPLRTRKLLLHQKEIIQLIGKTQQKGLTLIPLRIYFTPRGHAKVELALAKGKKQYDRRETIKEREASREVDRAMKDKRR